MKDEFAQEKVKKDEFLADVCDRMNKAIVDRYGENCGYAVSAGLTEMFYESLIDSIKASVLSGKKLILTGFGSFCVKTHKGHPVQFGDSASTVGSYKVVKFLPSNVLIRELRTDMAGDNE